MKMLRNIMLLVLVGIFLGCGATQKVKEPNASLDKMMSQKTFEFKARTAEPLVTQAMSQIATSGILPPGNTIGRIDVTGAGYFIKVKGDSVAAHLPYYGERQMAGGYDSDSGIKFEGIAKDLKISKDETKQNYTVKFGIDSSSEYYLVAINVTNSLSSSTSIQSSQRNRIRYSGDVVTVD